MQKAVIFDLDGTLIHSLPDITENLNIMLRHFGFDTVTLEKTKQIIGRGARNLVKDAIGCPVSDRDLDVYLNYYNFHYTNSQNKLTALFNGIAELLTQLKKRGYLIAICTNKPQQTTDKIYKQFLTEFNFDAVFGETPDCPVKPDKKSVMRVLDFLKVSPQNAYFVGDMQTDYLSAVNSGCKPVCVLWGYGERAKLSELGCSVFAETPLDVLRIIEQNSVVI